MAVNWFPILLLVAATLIGRTAVEGTGPFTYATPGQCQAPTAIFDQTALVCQVCASNTVANADGTACRCATGFSRATATQPCSDCTTQGMSSNRDGTRCMSCDSATSSSLNIFSRQCSCPSGFALVEASGTGVPLPSKQCQACPTGMLASLSDPYTCVVCPHPSMTVDSTGTCQCGSGYTQAGQTCVSTVQQTAIVSTYPLGLATIRQFRDVSPYDGAPVSSTIRQLSAVINDLFLWAVADCKYENDGRACQALLNLCVLDQYDPSTAPCAALAAIQASITLTVHDFGDWRAGLPLTAFSDTSVLSDMNLVGGVALSGSESTLQYMIVSYHLNGSLASIQPLTGELQLCPEHPARVGLFRQFGSQYENRCALSLQPLLTAPDTLFYDVFYVDNGKLFPVPVKNLNYREGGRLVNVDSSGVELTSPSARVVLHQRFVMYDNLSGRQGKTTSPPTILSYAVQTGLRVTMQSGSSSLIYPPLLVIRHSEREAVSLNDDLGSWSTVLFRAEYTKDLTSVWTAAEILFTLSLLTIGAVWLLHLWRMSLNYDVDHVNRKFLVEALSYLVLVASDILYWLVFIMCTYFLLFFKCQSTAFILLPLEDSQEEYVFTTVVIFVFFGKQISVDLFFMDWEKPKLVSGNETGASSSVSVWRKLFVANEWNELATARNVNVDLLLIVLLFLLRGINLEYLATSQPSLSLTPGSASINILLRFAVSSGLIMLLSLAQLVYRQLVHHRLFAHQAAEFIDFMTMSNISAFVLDSNFHGYYIHGRTLHAFADSSMEEMTRQLHMERKEMVKERGLIGGKDTFEMFVTPDFRLHYISIFLEMAHLRRGLKPFSLAATTERGATKDQQGFRPGDDVALAKASAKLNRFLCSFIDRNSSTYSWAESERTFTQRVLDIPPAIRQSNMTLFYDDPNYKFTSLFLVGIEYQIVTFLAALYAVCDITFSNTFVSIMVVYAANQTLSYVRHHWGQINISKKTLVDERFLI